MTWPLIFRRLRQKRSRGDRPTPHAAAADAATPAQEEHCSAKLAEETEEDLQHSLRAKLTRILKDLSVDTPAVNIAAVVGGKNKADTQNSSGTAPKSKDHRDQN